MIRKMNKLLSKYIFTGSVVFNVKSMNNIDKINVINNIENIKKNNAKYKQLKHY